MPVKYWIVFKVVTLTRNLELLPITVLYHTSSISLIVYILQGDPQWRYLPSSSVETNELGWNTY